MADSEIIRTMGALVVIILAGSHIMGAGAVMAGGCRTFCGNITVDYPFGIEQGCGHPKYRDLVYCINNVMMFHVISGSYEVVNIDYGFKLVDIFDPKMSTCASMHKSDGFFLEEARARYLQPTPDNAFMLLGCSKVSPLFEGFPDKHLPCRNVTGMGCDAFYDCPSWVGFGKKSRATSPPPCCGIPYSSIGSLNLSRLQCYSYATVYDSAPIKIANPREWSYGIQLSFSLPEDSDFCRSCKASKGVCGYDVVKENNLCLCDGWNSTTSCDPGTPSAGATYNYRPELLSLLFAAMLLITAI